jgi:hypothetical protein
MIAFARGIHGSRETVWEADAGPNGVTAVNADVRLPDDLRRGAAVMSPPARHF